MKTTTRQDYQRRLLKVMEYIHKNLDKDLDVNTLAEVALMSPYHFHRIYREMAKETVNGTVRRLRLQHAAMLLIRDETAISKIAKHLLYGSIEAFSRAFSQQFGETPLAYRERGRKDAVAFNQMFIATFPDNDEDLIPMFDVEIIEIKTTPLIGYPHQGDYMEIGEKFENLFLYANTHNLLTETSRSFGIYKDDPKSCPENELRSLACLSVDKDISLSGDQPPEKLSIPEMKCATIIFKGPYTELDKAYDWLFGQWLPQSGHEAGDYPAIEEYLNNPKDVAPSELLTKIHCPLK